MQEKSDTVHYFSELYFISKGLMEVSFNFSEAKGEPGKVKELIHLSFTPTVKSINKSSGVSVDTVKRETMTLSLQNMRSFAEALKLGGVSFIEPTRDIFLRDQQTGDPIMPEKYRTFRDLESLASTQKTVSIKPSYNDNKPSLNVVFSGQTHANITVSFDPQQARGFGEEVLHQSNDFSKELNIYKRVHSS